MRQSHYEALQPVCPRCLQGQGQSQPLHLEVLATADDTQGRAIITAGRLLCTNDACQQEYPIIDGVPIVVPNVREYVQAYQAQLLQRADMNTHVQSLIGDCLGPDSVFNQTRQYLSTYAADGYAEFEDSASGPTSASAALLKQINQLAGPSGPGPLLDLGCAVGRTSLDLAVAASDAGNELVLGIDQQFAMVQFAQRLLQQGAASYPLRSTGMVYEDRTIRLPRHTPANLDYWVCDAAVLPFANATFATAYGLNLLDSVANPVAVLASAARALQPGGSLRLATPFEWSSQVTPTEHWIGGHSQRSALGGDPVAMLQNMIGRADAGLDNLRIVAQEDGLCWQTRITDRSFMQYQAYGLILERQ